jgi:colanic acid/amylovoran biosynthesis glycosyltransferase
MKQPTNPDLMPWMTTVAQTHVEPRRMAYLSATHPMLSMTFIVREIDGLEKLGFDIEIASVNNADRPLEKLTAVEARQAAKTYYILGHGVKGALAAHAWTLLKRPAAYLRGWRRAAKLAGPDLGSLFKHAAYLTEALMLGRWMHDRKLEHVHVHLGSQPATVGLLAKYVFGVGLSITVHGADEFYDSIRQHLAEKVADADFIVCISQFARSQLMFVSYLEHWHRLLVCRLGIDVSHFAPIPYKRTRADEPFEILCVGRLSPAKGQKLLILAVERLHRMGRPVRLNVVGAGVYMDPLKEQVKASGLDDVVTMTGPVNQDHILEHYKRADCFALPSFAEGIPVVLMEAMSMQIPCVTTYITGIPELITSGETGLLAPPSDVDELVRQLDCLIQDPALAKRLGEAGRKKVLEDYHLEGNVEMLATIFTQRVKDSPRPD